MNYLRITGFIVASLLTGLSNATVLPLQESLRVEAPLGKYSDTEPAVITAKGPVLSEVPQRLSLREAILLSLKNNPDVLNSEIDRINAKYTFNLAQRQYRWQYGLAGSAGLNYARVDDVGLPRTSHALITPTAKRLLSTGTEVSLALDEQRDTFEYHPKAKLSISQPLLRGLKSDVVLKGYYDALDQETISRMDLKNQIGGTVVEVIKAYRQLISTNSSLDIAKQSLHDSEETFGKNAKQIELGTLPRTTNVSVEAQVAALRLRLVETENQARVAKRQLLAAMGIEEELAITVPSDVDIQGMQVPALADTLNYALANNTEFQKSLLSYQQHRRDEIKARDDMKWQLDLTGSVSVGGGGSPNRSIGGFDTLTNRRNHTEEIGLGLTIPIDDLSRKAALVRATTQIEKDSNSLKKVHYQLTGDIKNSIATLQSLKEQVRLSAQSVELERKNYNLQVKKQELGQGTSLEVTNSQNALIQARISLITTKINYLNAMTDLQYKLGSLLDQWKINIRY